MIALLVFSKKTSNPPPPSSSLLYPLLTSCRPSPSHRKLREDLRVLSLKNERYELEISGGGGGGQIPQQLLEMMEQAANKNHSEAEFAGQFLSLLSSLSVCCLRVAVCRVVCLPSVLCVLL
jgi:hypothetical protein